MKDRDELLDHNYDGIQEYDNALPRWWLYLFYITIAFAVIYPFVYDFGPGTFPVETVDQEVAQLAHMRGEQPGAAAVDLMKLAADAATVAQGGKVFAANCVPCHGDKGQGIIGPNLTDEYWIHGGTIENIRTTVSEGVLEKGMLAWKNTLSAGDLNAVVAYLWTLRGTNPPNPKAPEGQKAQ